MAEKEIFVPGMTLRDPGDQGCYSVEVVEGIQEESKDFHNGRKEGVKQATADIKGTLIEQLREDIELRRRTIAGLQSEITALVQAVGRVELLCLK